MATPGQNRNIDNIIIDMGNPVKPDPKFEFLLYPKAELPEVMVGLTTTRPVPEVVAPTPDPQCSVCWYVSLSCPLSLLPALLPRVRFLRCYEQAGLTLGGCGIGHLVGLLGHYLLHLDFDVAPFSFVSIQHLAKSQPRVFHSRHSLPSTGLLVRLLVCLSVCGSVQCPLGLRWPIC